MTRPASAGTSNPRPKYLEQVSLQWDATLGRLKQFVEDEVVK